MNENMKIFLVIICLLLMFTLIIGMLLVMPLLYDKLEYEVSGDSPMHRCKAEGGVYRDRIFEPSKCYIGNEIYEVYNKDGVYKLAK